MSFLLFFFLLAVLITHGVYITEKSLFPEERYPREKE
jgi:hypothetical protein